MRDESAFQEFGLVLGGLTLLFPLYHLFSFIDSIHSTKRTSKTSTLNAHLISSHQRLTFVRTALFESKET